MPCKHGVSVTANHKNVVLISALRLSDDIVVGTVLADSLDEDSGWDGGGVAHLGKKLVANLLSNTDNRGVITVTSESARQGLKWNIIVDDGSGCTSSFGVRSLDGKGASTTRNERHVASNPGREVGGIAAHIANLDQVALDIVGSRTVGQVVGLHVCAGNSQLDCGGSEQLNEGLLVDLPVVIAIFLQAIVEPFGCAVISQLRFFLVLGAYLRVVTTTTKGTVSTVLVSNPLELLRSLDQVLELDILDQVLLVDEFRRLSRRNRTENASTGDEQIESHIDS